MRSSQRNSARRNKRGQQMTSFPESDTDAVAWGWEKAAQWFNFCPTFNNIPGGAQISKHRDLWHTPVYQPAWVGARQQREQIHHPSSVKKKFYQHRSDTTLLPCTHCAFIVTHPALCEG